MATNSSAVVVFALVAICCLIGTTEANRCSAGTDNCDRNWKNGCETNIWSDVKNCGKCHYCCPDYPYAVTSCYKGSCKYVCKKGWLDCDRKIQNGCEVDGGKDPKNCGRCNNCCPTYPYAYPKCEGGVCKSICKPLWADCNNKKEDGCEIDIGKDVNNCGKCKNKCTCPPYPGWEAYCQGGECKTRCRSGYKMVWSKGKSSCVKHYKH